MDALANAIAELEANGPVTYARWSRGAWRNVCSGPAAALWQAMDAHPQRERVLAGYLTLLHAAVGLQYIALDRDGRMDLSTFLARAFCETLPKTLPRCAGEEGLRALAAIWNIGERLQTKAPWLDRYLAARLVELDALTQLSAFMEKALEEGLEAQPDASFSGELTWQVLDCSYGDRRFLPGDVHLATPSILCVHDRLRPGVHTAVLLRRGKDALSLGSTPCLGSAQTFTPPEEKKWRPLLTSAQAPLALEPSMVLATRGGFIVCAARYSQRLWIARAG
jgi:hypothetical protein